MQTGAPVSQKGSTGSDENLVVAFPTDTRNFIHELAEKAPAAFGFDYHGMLVQDLKKPVKPIRAWYATDVIYMTARVQAGDPVRERHRAHAGNRRRQTDRRAEHGPAQRLHRHDRAAELKADSVPANAPTILNVFSDTAAGRPPAGGLTRLDLAHLRALYAINPCQVGAMQNDQIADRIQQDLAGHQ